MNTLRNKVSLIGRLGMQPEIVEYNSGTKRVRLSIATNESYKDKNGEWIENTQWHYAYAWGTLAELIGKKLEKGSEVMVQGRLVNRSFETKTGEKRYVTEIEVSEFLILGPKVVK